MNTERVFQTLREHGLLEARDAVLGGLSIAELPQRNLNFIVRCSTRPGYFVKCPGSENARSAQANEALFYAKTLPGQPLDKLGPFVPTFYLYDAAAGVLVLKLYSDRVGGSELADLSFSRGPQLPQRLGSALASCHSLARDDDATARSGFSSMVPWAFNLGRPAPEMFRTLTPLQLDAIRLIHQQDDVISDFEEMRREWVWTSLTHGDIRWVNLMAEVDELSGDIVGLNLLDWEGAGIGDPAWDVASVFSAYMSHCLLSLPLDDAETPAAAAEMFASQLPTVRGHMRRFWMAYVAESKMTEHAASPLLRRAFRYSGMRLLQFAFEWAQIRTQMPRFVLCSLQLAMNIVTDSDEGRAALLRAG